MAKESTVMSLLDLYEEEFEVLTFLETSLSALEEESQRWNGALHSHMNKVLNASKFLKIKSFASGLEWLNTTKPLTLVTDLKDRILVLDFFTYCCINCEHSLRYIQEVKLAFEGNPELVIIGVHSPKFPNERAIDSVKNAIRRNKISHPVINDPENSLWNKLGVYCWPTVLILSPDHRVLFSLVGEKQIEKLGYLCNQIMNYFRKHNILLNKHQLCLKRFDDNFSADTLLYPSGISTKGNSIMVSDTGHNRLLLLSIEGKVLHIIGSGIPGCNDGSFASASFDRPHGTEWWKTYYVFVADTGNHSIRMIDLKAKSVSTVFNASMLDTEYNENIEKGFASPWDVCLGSELGTKQSELNVLYIAVAGSHQIWTMNLEHSLLASKQFSYLKCVPFAGNGKEECRNNLYKMKAGFAQPSGICYSELHSGTLFIADSESSTVRFLSLVDGSVKTLVGGGLDPKDLFQYGDTDGVGDSVKLQHPLSICVMEKETICFTDTYNHKLKLIDVPSKECTTIAGNGTKGKKCEFTAKEAEFDEPSGISYSLLKKSFFVVDTNNHCIKVFDPKTNVVEFLPLKFKESSCTDGPTFPSVEYATHSKDSEELKSSKINLGNKSKLSCTFKLNQLGVPSRTDLKLAVNILKGNCSWNIPCISNDLFNPSEQPGLEIQFTNDLKDSKVCLVEVLLGCNFILCDAINNVCMPKKVSLKFDIELSSDGSKSYNAVFPL